MMEPMQPTPDTNRRIRQRSWGVMAAHYGKLIGAQPAYAGLVYAAVLLFALPLSFLGTLFAIAPRFPLALAGYMARLLPDCAATVQPSVEGDCACR